MTGFSIWKVFCLISLNPRSVWALSNGLGCLFMDNFEANLTSLFTTGVEGSLKTSSKVSVISSSSAIKASRASLSPFTTGLSSSFEVARFMISKNFPEVSNFP